MSCSLPQIRNKKERKPRVGTSRAGNRAGKVKLSDGNTCSGDTILPAINVKRSSGTQSQDQGIGSNYQSHLESFMRFPGNHEKKMKPGLTQRPPVHQLKNEGTGPISLPPISINRPLAMCNMKEDVRNERRTDGRPQDPMSILPHPPSAARTTQVTQSQRQRLLRRRAMKDLDRY